MFYVLSESKVEIVKLKFKQATRQKLEYFDMKNFGSIAVQELAVCRNITHRKNFEN